MGNWQEAVLLGAGVLAIAAVFLWIADLALRRWLKVKDPTRHWIMIVVTVIVVLALVLWGPLDDNMRAPVLQFLGIVVSATIALASTTVLGNGMAGVMLRVIGSYRADDYLTVGDQAGRVTERGLFHTEIQTEDQTLTTLPNMYLVTNPVTTVRSGSTLIATSVSLGYDVPRSRVQNLMIDAARTAGLDEETISVRILALGDFSVTYRVAGRTKDTTKILGTRSELNAAVLDALHEGGIEIVSPSFMNQRVYPVERRFIPERVEKDESLAAGASPDATAYDKAELAGTIESLQAKLEEATKAISEREKLLKSADDASPEEIERELESLQTRKARLERVIEVRTEQVEEDD